MAPVQTYLGKKITQYLSEKTDTQLAAERIKISPWDGAILQGVSITAENDTLFYGGDINLSVRKNLFFLLNNELDLSYIGLKNIHLHVHTKLGESKSNLTRFIDHFKSKSSDKPTIFDLDFQDLHLDNVSVSLDNENKGKIDEIKVGEGDVELNRLDLKCLDFDIKKIELYQPEFFTSVYNYQCDINDELGVEQIDKSTILDLLEFSPDAVDAHVSVQSLLIHDGKFGKENKLIPTTEDEGLDYQNFYFDKINFDLSSFSFTSWEGLTAQLNSLSCFDNHGFKVENVSIDTIHILPYSMTFNGLSIETEKSDISSDMNFSYATIYGFKNILQDIAINFDVDFSEVHVGDLLHFARGLEKNIFLYQNKNETIDISGKFSGRINNLSGKDVNIRMGKYFDIAGVFYTRDLLDSDNTLLNIRIDQFYSDIHSLKTVIPTFNLPGNFNKLGRLDFSGRFDGYLHDFVAYGKLDSDLGRAELDMRLDLSEGTGKARYSGNLNLQEFDLGKWSDNPNLGLANFKSKVTDGVGLTLNTVKADLHAVIENFEFKTYRYNNLILDGVIEKNTFDGKFSSEDPNIKMVFDGEVQYIDNKAFLNFKSKITNLDLFALHLYKSPLAFSGDLDIHTSGKNLNDFIGEIDFSNVTVKKDSTMQKLDIVKMIARQTAQGDRYIRFDGDFIQGEIEGQYYIQDLIKGIKKTLWYNLPGFAQEFADANLSLNSHQDFKFNFKLEDSQNILSLLAIPVHNIKNLNVKGHINTDKNTFSLAGVIGELWFEDNFFEHIDILTSASNKSGSFIASTGKVQALGLNLNPIFVNTSFSDETITFNINTEKLLDSLENVDIKGSFMPNEKGFLLNLDNTSLSMLGKKWQVTSGNSVLIGKKFINIDNFNLTDGYRTIDLNDVNQNKGVHVELQNFDIDLINGLLHEKRFLLSGLISLSAEVNDVFSPEKSVKGYLHIPTIYVNKTGYGNMFVDFELQNSDDIQASLTLGEFFAAKGNFSIKNKEYHAKAKLRDAPLNLLQHLLKDGIANTKGLVQADIKLDGQGKDLKLSGDGVVKDGSTKVLVNGATYFFDNQYFTISEKDILFDNVTITDENGTTGKVNGKLFHSYFKNFGVDATITGSNVIGLNTTKADNPVYYGYGIGDFVVNLQGYFSDLHIDINAITREGSKLFIPVDDSEYAENESVIKFVNKSEEKKIETAPPLTNITLNMTLSITPEAEASIIFDEAKGDIIKGRGRGNLKITMSKNENLEMFGDYEIEQGEYLFTVTLLPVAKPFIVDRGGIIRWTGDPLNTTLNITANYRSRTSIRPFIEEYITLAPTETQRLAEQRTDVDLKLKLGGTLFNPVINFDVSFPNLPSELASYADSKLRLLRNNELELNSQVLGLIVLNTFLPANSLSDIFGSGGLQSVGVNTLSEFLSSQLSMHITSLLNSVIAENGVLSGVDFDLGLHNNTISGSLLNSNLLLPDEINFTLKNRFKFLDERFSLNLGANYVLQNQGVSVNQVLPDYAVEFLLTDDKKLKIRTYGKTDIDPVNLGQLRQKYGFGLAYRTEFGSMLKLTNTPKDTIKQ